jgi:type I restriction enzyme M protein
MTENILQYESKIWNTADLLRGSGIKESEWPAYMMPFFALMMIESRLIRLFDELKAANGETIVEDVGIEDFRDLVDDERQGYNEYIFEKNKSLKDVCLNDKTFEIDFDAYLTGFDGETKDLLGIEVSDDQKFLDISGVIAKLKKKKVLFQYVQEWSKIDLKPYDNSEITTLEEHIKRKWADISAETAGEQYTPNDVISLIAEIIASKVEENDKLLKIYDCTCGGGNLLFGVEDRINKQVNRFTQTFGQDWNDALYALARIESRFRDDAEIAHGNTLVDDAFYNDEFDVVIANPPYGVSWKGYQSDIKKDKTQRFKFLPSVSDGQLLFMQHLISKLNLTGMGVVVHNGSTLFSGDAGSAESNIRKWMLESDIVEAVIQLPTDEFFNTGIYTYLWVLNKRKEARRKDKVVLINASEKYKPLKKNRGHKRKEIDAKNRLEIVEILEQYEDNDYARVFEKEFFYFNKQAIQLTNVDESGKSFEAKLEEKKKSLKLEPVRIFNDEVEITEFEITTYDEADYASLKDFNNEHIKPLLASLDYAAQNLVVETENALYFYDSEKETLIKEEDRAKEALGCGKIIIKSSYKKATKTQSARIEISIELTPDYEKDYEIIPYHRDEAENEKAIADFMAKYISKPFIYLDKVIGVEINFNKVFYKPEKLRPVPEILAEIEQLGENLNKLEGGLSL